MVRVIFKVTVREDLSSGILKRHRFSPGKGVTFLINFTAQRNFVFTEIAFNN